MTCRLPCRILVDLTGMRMASIAAGVSLAHVGDGGLRVHRLDLERGYERVLGFDRHLIRGVPDLDADRIPQGHVCSLRDPTASGLSAWVPPPGSNRNSMAHPSRATECVFHRASPRGG